MSNLLYIKSPGDDSQVKIEYLKKHFTLISIINLGADPVEQISTALRSQKFRLIIAHRDGADYLIESLCGVDVDVPVLLLSPTMNWHWQGGFTSLPRQLTLICGIAGLDLPYRLILLSNPYAKIVIVNDTYELESVTALKTITFEAFTLWFDYHESLTNDTSSIL